MTTFLFGVFNGFSLCLLGTSIVILALDVGRYELGDEVFKDRKALFLNEYRLWKATGFIIIYIWIFALSFHIYEREGINYNLIFDYKSKTIKSTFSLGVATFYALLWTTFFVFYCLNLLGLCSVATVEKDPPLPITIFFPIIIFFTFLISSVIKLMRARKGVLYFLNTIVQILLTPFGFY
jgi:hypothetical protein